MNHTFSVNHNVNFPCRNREQMRRLNHLKAFVHHRGRIHGDFCAHLPGGVRQCLFYGNIFKFRPRFSEKGTAGGSEYQLFDLFVLPCTQGLENSGVFTVHRRDTPAVCLGARQHRRAGNHQRLFVGKRQIFAGFQRRKGREKPRLAENGIDGKIRFGLPDHFKHAVLTAKYADVGIGKRCPQSLCRPGVCHGNRLRVKQARLLLRSFIVTVCRQPQNRIAGTHRNVYCLLPDRAGGAEYQ